MLPCSRLLLSAVMTDSDFAAWSSKTWENRFVTAGSFNLDEWNWVRGGVLGLWHWHWYLARLVSLGEINGGLLGCDLWVGLSLIGVIGRVSGSRSKIWLWKVLLCNQVIVIYSWFFLALQCIGNWSSTVSNRPFRIRKDVVLSIRSRRRPRC